jgi:hypothetical protein
MTRARVVELIEITGRNREIIGHAPQKTCRVLVHPAVCFAEDFEPGLFVQGGSGIAVVPLAEATAHMRVLLQIGLIGWEPHDEHPDQVLVPLLVVVDRLIELDGGCLQILPGERSHRWGRYPNRRSRPL